MESDCVIGRLFECVIGATSCAFHVVLSLDVAAALYVIWKDLLLGRNPHKIIIIHGEPMLMTDCFWDNL